MRKSALNILCLLLLIFAIHLHAQEQPPQLASSPEQTLPAYDVVSIKPSQPNASSPSVWNNMDRYVATDISLRRLLQDAYDIRQELISGIPGPIDNARFDFTAKIFDPNVNVLKNLTDEQWRTMRRAMLVEHFQLKAHTAMKSLPVYELVVTKNGPKFKPSDGKGDTGMSVNSHGRLTGHNVPMSRLATALSNQFQKAVIDKTGLTGRYDFTLRWSNDISDAVPEAEVDTGPSLFTALQEQLGLKLQSAKGPVETLVVDHVEMPVEN